LQEKERIAIRKCVGESPLAMLTRNPEQRLQTSSIMLATAALEPLDKLR
jgi:hypothetical protein